MATDYRSPFGLPLFRDFWLASMASNAGAQIQLVGASWMMASLTTTPQMIALVQTSLSLPIMLLSLWGGAIADNLDRRRVMLATQGFLLITSASLAIGAWEGVITPWLLLSFTFLIGCGTAINGPAWQAAVGDMVPRPLLPKAVMFNGMGFNIARSVGPAIGGVIVALGGAASAFLVNSLSYVGLIAVLGRWRPEHAVSDRARERLLPAMGAGVRFAWASPQLRAVLIRTALFSVASSGLVALMPLAARDIIGGEAIVYGLMLGAFGMGAVIGAFSSDRVRNLLSTEALVRLSSLAVAIGGAVVASSAWLAVTLPALALAGAGWLLALGTANMSVQMIAPRWIVAREIALYQMAIFGGLAVGSWMFGFVANNFGVAIALYLASGCQLLSIVAARYFRFPEQGGGG